MTFKRHDAVKSDDRNNPYRVRGASKHPAGTIVGYCVIRSLREEPVPRESSPQAFLFRWTGRNSLLDERFVLLLHGFKFKPGHQDIDDAAFLAGLNHLP